MPRTASSNPPRIPSSSPGRNPRARCGRRRPHGRSWASKGGLPDFGPGPAPPARGADPDSPQRCQPRQAGRHHHPRRGDAVRQLQVRQARTAFTDRASLGRLTRAPQERGSSLKEPPLPRVACQGRGWHVRPLRVADVRRGVGAGPELWLRPQEPRRGPAQRGRGTQRLARCSQRLRPARGRPRGSC